PGTGDYTLTLWLEDEARNLDPSLASHPVHLRLDELAPRSPGFDPPDASDPRRLALAVSDEGSGVADAAIQVRRRPDGDWRALPRPTAGGASPPRWRPGPRARSASPSAATTSCSPGPATSASSSRPPPPCARATGGCATAAR